MNTHDKYELPPLPYPQIPGNDYTAGDMREYATAAIEPYAKRIAELESQLEAIGAGGVTQGQRLIEADRQRRGEPVAWLTPGMQLHLYNPEDFTDWKPLYFAPQPAEPLKECGLCHNMRTLDPAERSDEPDLAKCAECGAEMIHVRPGKWQHPDCPQSFRDAEPVKVPSDTEIDDLWDLHEDSRTIARALLARYGAQPAAHAAAKE